MKSWICLLFLLLAPQAWGDSPLTSTDFWKAYQDVPEVQLSHDIERLNTRLAYYLMDTRNSIDKKAAVINALSWKIDGKENAMLFREVLAIKYKTDRVEKRLSADETFCLGYLTALDDYFHPEPSWKFLQQARKRSPKSFTVAIVTALVDGQIHFSEQNKVWGPTAAVLNDKTLKQDMRAAAKDTIVRYMSLYK